MPNRKLTLVAILLATQIAACSGSPSRESSGEYFDDTAITAKVKAAFFQDKVVKATDVNVDTFKGNVQLSGFADSRIEIERAAQIAGQVPGVRTVRNDILVKRTAP